jgi:NitT/TauT family transport system substrate-binding protein
MKTILNSLALLLITVAVSATSDKTVIRVAHFPNITHAQGLIAHNLSREGKGWFEARLGPGVEIQWFTYNAGPSAMEAIFAKSIELTYVGPGPALNAYEKSQGEEIRVIAGAANGGAALVVQPDANLKAPADFKGKRIATPQLGNTQDISCRAWLTSGGLRITQLGGDAQVLPTQNPDQLSLFQQKKIVKAELLAETRSDISAELIAHAWKRIIFTSEIPRASVQAFVANSQKAGFMKTAPDISRLFETP